VTRLIDKERTEQARRRQKAGVDRLDAYFNVPVWYRRWRGVPMVSGLRGLVLRVPPRVRPHCPPLRDASAKARHLKRKRARAARRMNRC
jgi:hypothetical protein